MSQCTLVQGHNWRVPPVSLQKLDKSKVCPFNDSGVRSALTSLQEQRETMHGARQACGEGGSPLLHGPAGAKDGDPLAAAVA